MEVFLLIYHYPTVTAVQNYEKLDRLLPGLPINLYSWLLAAFLPALVISPHSAIYQPSTLTSDSPCPWIGYQSISLLSTSPLTALAPGLLINLYSWLLAAFLTALVISPHSAIYQPSTLPW